jgi:carbonic anhydrase/acetyltransferase-like protein (isoleucine patch superfamily)
MSNRKSGYKKVSSIQSSGFLVNLFFELSIQFIAILLAVSSIWLGIKASNLIILSLFVLLAAYIYPLTILLLVAFLTKILPKPKLGFLRAEDRLKYQVLSALNKFMRRTPAQWLLIFPFPGNLFYQIAGNGIHPSAFILDQNIPDPYLVSIGKNTILGSNCTIAGHYSPSASQIVIGKVKIGNDVVIGADSIIPPNVVIADRAIVQVKSLLNTGTIISEGEIWGGIPARKLSEMKEELLVETSPDFQLIEKEICDLVKQLYDVTDLTTPFSALNLAPSNIGRMLLKIEQKYNLVIDRTSIDLQTLDLHQTIQMAIKAMQ